MNEMNLFCSIS